MTYVVDRQGRLVAEGDGEFATGQDMARFEIVKKFVDQGGRARLVETSEFSTKQDHGSVSMLGTYSPVPSLEWAVIAQKDQHQAYASVYEMQRYSRLLALMAVLLSVGISSVAARTIAKPLEQLTVSSRAIANGDFSQRVHITSRTEIGELASTFNHMTEDLERFVQDLKRAAEEAKIELSRASEAAITIPGLFALETRAVDVDVVLDRATLETLMGRLVERSLAVCQRLLARHAVRPEELPVRLEPDPARGRHGLARELDEALEVAVEQRLADPVQDERLEVGEGGREPREGLARHVALGDPSRRLLHAHRAAEVAARRHLDEELRRVRTERRRSRIGGRHPRASSFAGPGYSAPAARRRVCPESHSLSPSA
jgi:HAMP domain-containing protein